MLFDFRLRPPVTPPGCLRYPLFWGGETTGFVYSTKLAVRQEGGAIASSNHQIGHEDPGVLAEITTPVLVVYISTCHPDQQVPLRHDVFDSRQLYSTGVGVCLGNTSPPVGRCHFLKRSPLKVLCPPQIHGVLAFRLLVNLRSDFTGTGRAVKVVVGTNCGLRCYCNILLHDTRELPRWEAAGYQEGGLCPNLLVDLKSTQAELTTAMHPEHHIPRVRDREGRSDGARVRVGVGGS
jgi:hypothetical protein